MIKVRCLLGCVLMGLIAGRLPAQRQTVFVLVDESGSLKADRSGWRKQAASLLAYSLSDGSSMSLSGFGDSGRRLDLTPRLLDYSLLGIQRRDALARIADSLKDTDRQTDLFGAIEQALSEASKMDPSLRKSAPPVLVVLSDFRPDPVPDAAAQQNVCDELGKSHVDLIEVGFGSLDRKTSDYLARCAGTTLWGAVSDPAALPEIFWKLQNRFTRSLKVFDDIPGTHDVHIPVPEWAEELLVLGLNERTGATTSDWNWSSDNLMQTQKGDRYRLARFSSLKGGERRTQISIKISGGTEGVKLIAVARGPLMLRVIAEPPEPWFRSEIVSVVASIRSTRSGAPVTEWQSAAGAQSAGELTIVGGTGVPLRLDGKSKSFEGTVTVPFGPRLKAEAIASIDGALWSGDLEGAVVALPVDAGLDSQGRMIVRAWTSGQLVGRELRSNIPNREFEVILSTAGPVEINPKTLRFNASSTEASVAIRAKPESTNRGTFAGWFEDRPARVGSITLSTRLKSGQLIETSQSIPVVVEMAPLWQRVGLALGTTVALLAGFVSFLRGRRLPSWFLVTSDGAGNPVRGAEPILLSAYRGSLHLAQFGMPGAIVYKSAGGRVGVRLRGGVRLQPAGSSKPLDVSHPSLDSRLGLGDSLHYHRPDGTTLIFKIDEF